MTLNLPSVFEGAVAEVLIQHANIPDFPRIRTWRSVDAEARWSPDFDRVFPIIAITASTPGMDEQSQPQVSVRISVMCKADRDQARRRFSEIEGAVQECIDALESQYKTGGEFWQTFTAAVESETSNAGASIHLGGITRGAERYPEVADDLHGSETEITIHYSKC
jgi:hypothetical protein